VNRYRVVVLVLLALAAGYFLPLVMLSNDRLYPVTLGRNAWNGYTDRQPILYQYTVGGAFLSVLPLMVLMVFLRRYWKGGLTDGAVKD
jgi:multiple sugar transport system permease protein